VNVLVVAPHPDDEAIGCGGAVCQHATRGDRVSVVFLTSGELGLKHLPREQAWRTREAEAEAAAVVLGLARVTFLRRPDWFVGERVEETAAALRPVLDQEKPKLLYLPHPEDEHPDHRASLAVVRTALRGGPAPAARAYEVWSPLSGFDHVEDIGPVMRRKLWAVRCYRSQLGHFRYDRAVRGLNQYRGALAARCRFAEIFRHLDVSEPPELGPNQLIGASQRPEGL
jgi:LmbE family N-acetylglucosaminyl deacetylase